jgi:hypothetical protein
MGPSARIGAARVPAPATLAGLEANARLARETRMVVHLMVPREPGVVEHARAAATRERVIVRVDMRPRSIRIRFSLRPPVKPEPLEQQ